MAYTSIAKNREHYDNLIWTGTGSSRSITGLLFQPDMFMCKDRDSATHHILYDAVRGNATYDERIYPSSNALQDTGNNNDITAVNSDGFTFNSDNTNQSGVDFYGDFWKLGGEPSTNSNGTINTSCSVNTAAGISCITWTGTGSNATLGHGLGQKPNVILTKRLGTATWNWQTYWSSYSGNAKTIALNIHDAASSSDYWQSTDPTDTVFSIYDGASLNNSGESYVAYCFAEKKGFSKFGHYIGNGNNNGPRVFTGGRPNFVVVKNADSSASGSSEFILVRNASDGDSGTVDNSYWNVGNMHNRRDSYWEANAEQHDPWHWYANGFKARGTSNYMNKAGDNYVYMCFNHTPIVGSNGTPGCAY